MAGKIGIIVQARMGSTRLPGKSLMPLAGEPLVGRILERLKRTSRPDRIILAIPNRNSDDPLEDLGKKYCVEVFRGSEENLLDRYYQAACEYNLKTVIRFPADNPVPESKEIDRIIDYHLNNQFDFCSNLSQVFENKYPDGIGAEVFDFKKLEYFWKTEKDPEKLEHVHLNFFNYKTQTPVQDVKVSTLLCPQEFCRPEVILDVNTPDDYKFMSKLYDDLYPNNPFFHITDILNWIDRG
jgi:spore coat polysaccharide biosynthesis protein SpsF